MFKRKKLSLVQKENKIESKEYTECVARMKITRKILGKLILHCGSVCEKYYLTFFNDTSIASVPKREKNEIYSLVLDEKEKTDVHKTLQLSSWETGTKMFGLYSFCRKKLKTSQFLYRLPGIHLTHQPRY